MSKIYTNTCSTNGYSLNKQYGRDKRKEYIDACPTNSGDATASHEQHYPEGDGQYIKAGMCDRDITLSESQMFKAAERFGRCVAKRETFRDKCVEKAHQDDRHNNYIRIMRNSQKSCNAQGNKKKREKEAAAAIQRQETVARMVAASEAANEDERLITVMGNSSQLWKKKFDSDNGRQFMADFGNDSFIKDATKVDNGYSIKQFSEIKNPNQLVNFIISKTFNRNEINKAIVNSLKRGAKLFIANLLRFRLFKRRAPRDTVDKETVLLRHLRSSREFAFHDDRQIQEADVADVKDWQDAFDRGDNPTQGGRRRTKRIRKSRRKLRTRKKKGVRESRKKLRSRKSRKKRRVRKSRKLRSRSSSRRRR